MKTSDVFPSRWLGHDDLDGDVTVTIRGIRIEEMQAAWSKEKQRKPVMTVEEFEKPLILNKTNWVRLSGLFGDESDGWVGKQIVLTVEKTRSPDGIVEAVRVRGAREEGKRAPAAAVKFSGDWRSAVVHFGKNNGRALGSLPANVLGWYQTEWQPRANPATKSFSGADLQLRMALDASLREMAPAVEPEQSDEMDVPS